MARGRGNMLALRGLEGLVRPGAALRALGAPVIFLFHYNLNSYRCFCLSHSPALPTSPFSQCFPSRAVGRQVTITRYGSFIPNNDLRINKQTPGMAFKTKLGAAGRLVLHCYCLCLTLTRVLNGLADSLRGRTFTDQENK